MMVNLDLIVGVCSQCEPEFDREGQLFLWKSWCPEASRRLLLLSAVEYCEIVYFVTHVYSK